MYSPLEPQMLIKCTVGGFTVVNLSFEIPLKKEQRNARCAETLLTYQSIQMLISILQVQAGICK
jgi:hypothetical protein